MRSYSAQQASIGAFFPSGFLGGFRPLVALSQYLAFALACLRGLGLAAFLWALRSGQREDFDGAASRILFDDEPESD